MADEPEKTSKLWIWKKNQIFHKTVQEKELI